MESWLISHQFKPFVVEALLRGRPGVRIFTQHLLDQRQHFRACHLQSWQGVVGVLELDLLGNDCLVLSNEWLLARDHHVEDDTSRPDVDFLSVASQLSLRVVHLRSSVLNDTSNISHSVPCWIVDPANIKVDEHNPVGLAFNK